jgi:DNA ligase 1
MLFAELAAASLDVRAAAARSAKVARLAAALTGLSPDEARAGVAFLSGGLLQRQTGVGWAALGDLPPPAGEPSLTVLAVDGAFASMAAATGAGSRTERRRLTTDLFGRATAVEQRLLRGLIAGELRQGAQQGVMVEAVARAAGIPATDVRRALMLRGDLGAVAAAALAGGRSGLQQFGIQIGRPLMPMLAATAADLEGALSRTPAAAVEWKLDGARVQVHRRGGDVAVFTRTLDDITDRLPEVADAALTVGSADAVLDGEAIALRADGRPLPFQLTARRIGSRRQTAALREELPITLTVFDALHLDGEDLLDRPARDRFAALDATVPAPLIVPRLIEPTDDEAAGFATDALSRGHEGVMVKALDRPYQAGRRGGGWLKVKRPHTLDLVVLAAEWGHGRRAGRLSNLHLGAIDPGHGFVMLGKTFKGLTDTMLAWQTDQLLARETSRTGHVVHVRPELVVEVAFDGVQASSRYPGGVALRFARVKRYRSDKRPEDADTIDAVRAIHVASAG